MTKKNTKSKERRKRNVVLARKGWRELCFFFDEERKLSAILSHTTDAYWLTGTHTTYSSELNCIVQKLPLSDITHMHFGCGHFAYGYALFDYFFYRWNCTAICQCMWQCTYNGNRFFLSPLIQNMYYRVYHDQSWLQQVLFFPLLPGLVTGTWMSTTSLSGKSPPPLPVWSSCFCETIL